MRVFSDCKQTVNCIAFSPDGKMLAVGGEECKIRIFDITSGSQLTEIKDHTSCIACLAWSPNNKQLASGCRDGSFRLWDIKKMSSLNDSCSSSSSTNRLISINTECNSLLRIVYKNDESITCIGI